MPRNSHRTSFSKAPGHRIRDRVCDVLLRKDRSHYRRYSPYSSSTSHNRPHSPLRSLRRDSPSPSRGKAGDTKDFIPGRERYYSPNSRRLYDAPIDWTISDPYDFDDAHYHGVFQENNGYNNSSDWINRSSHSRRDFYRSDDYDDDDSFKRFTSPPRTGRNLSLQTLNKRMDHFDSILTRLVSEVADKKRRPTNKSKSPPLRHSDRPRSTASATEDIEKLDRMMDELHILKNGSPTHDFHRSSSYSRSDAGISYMPRDRYRR